MTHWLNQAMRWISALESPANLSEWIKIVAVLVGAPWALVAFRRNNRIKAAELLLALEAECHKCLPTLLELEATAEYGHTYAGVLAKSINTMPSRKTKYTEAETNAIAAVEQVLRHFHACYHVRRLGVVGNALDRAYSYYLKMCVSQRRPALAKYIEHFWPSVYFWAQFAGEPGPKRMFIQAKQIWPRIQVWWRGPRALSERD